MTYTVLFSSVNVSMPTNGGILPYSFSGRRDYKDLVHQM